MDVSINIIKYIFENIRDGLMFKCEITTINNYNTKNIRFNNI